MYVRNKTQLRLSREDDLILWRIQYQTGVPDGQFKRRPQALMRITQSFNAATGRDWAPGEVHKYIETRRKRGLWFTFDGDYLHLPRIGMDFFSDEQWQIVSSIYEELGVAADRYQHDATNCDIMHKRMVLALKLQVDKDILVSLLIERRKRGLLPKVGTDRSTPGGPKQIGFADIGQVG